MFLTMFSVIFLLTVGAFTSKSLLSLSLLDGCNSVFDFTSPLEVVFSSFSASVLRVLYEPLS